MHILMQGYGARTRGAFEARLGPLRPKLDVRLSSYRPSSVVHAGSAADIGRMHVLWEGFQPFTLHINDEIEMKGN